MAVVLLFSPLDYWIFAELNKWQNEVMRLKDERIAQMTEVLNGILVVKLFSWEKNMEEKVMLRFYFALVLAASFRDTSAVSSSPTDRPI
jgi:hypothetical protein